MLSTATTSAAQAAAAASLLANSVTNHWDPESKRCRVFLGNLNTMKMSKSELETRFMRYGHVKGISVHKGFAFVQFTSEASARLAANNEDQKVYYGMTVDANIASEPKRRRKLPTNNRMQHSLFGPAPEKRPRIDFPGSGLFLPGSGISLAPGNPGMLGHVGPLSNKTVPSNLVALVSPGNGIGSGGLSAARKVVSMLDQNSKDIIVCGNCKELFQKVEEFLNHKSIGCRLRFTCRCKHINEPTKLICSYCKTHFPTAWELIEHCNTDHEVKIYESESEIIDAQSITSSTKEDDPNNTAAVYEDQDNPEGEEEETIDITQGEEDHEKLAEKGDDSEAPQVYCVEDDDDDVQEISTISRNGRQDGAM